VLLLQYTVTRFMAMCDYSSGMSWLAPGLFLVGLLLSLPLTAAMIAVGHRLQAMDSQGFAGHLKTLRRVPNVGGVAFVSAFVLPLLGGLLVLSGALPVDLDRLWQGAGAHAQRLQEGQRFGWTLLACTVWMLIAGAVDDRRAMGPGLKFALQALPAIALAWFADVRPLTLLDHQGAWGVGVSVALGVLWMLAITNAMNFLDNMDGLAGGVGAVSALLFMAGALAARQWFIAALFALLAGALLGFLCFNFRPRGGARIFMGDGGSQPLGLLLAALAVRCVFTDPADPQYALGTHWYGVLTPVAVLAIPIYDLLATSVLRIRQGRSPLVGDQQHLSHRLVERGFSKHGAVMAIWALTAITGIGGVGLGSAPPWLASLLLVQSLLAVAVLAWAEGILKR
jgi:UDP-GlcNAc:undecaprenyl-phosphate GlcNAc-1-phosphate transferase